MKKIYTFLFFMLFALGFTQNTDADSLILVFAKTGNPTKRLELLNEISQAYKTSDPVSMQVYAEEALSASKKIGNKKEQAKALQNLAGANSLSGNYAVALKYYGDAEKLLLQQDPKDKEIINILVKVTANRGIIYSEQNNYSKALKSYFEALSYSEKLDNGKSKSLIYNNIGVVYRSIEDDKKALKYFLNAYEIQKKSPEFGFGDICSNIGLIYLNQNNLSQAKAYFDEAFKFFQKNSNSRGLGELYNSLSEYYLMQKQPENAKQNLFKAEQIFKNSGDDFGLSDTYLFLSRIFFGENKLDEALEDIQKSAAIAEELDLPEAKMNCEEMLSKIFEQKGDKNLALIHLKNYNDAAKILTKVENSKERIRTELNFEYQKQNIAQKEKAGREKLWLLLGFLLLSSISGISFLIYKSRKVKENILLQKQLAEFQHKALHLQMNPHFVFNCLAAISSFIVQNGKEDAIKYLSKFSKLMRLTLDFSKESLISIDKEIEALKNYLELEQLRFQNKFDFKIYKDSQIEDDTAIPSLLLQPYVENAIIHGVVPKAEKGFLHINFMQNDNSLICTIEDDGIGIETSQKKKENSVNIHKSMALEISKKRLETMEKLEKKKAKVKIEELKSENGTPCGTKVTLELPLEYLKS